MTADLEKDLKVKIQKKQSEIRNFGLALEAGSPKIGVLTTRKDNDTQSVG